MLTFFFAVEIMLSLSSVFGFVSSSKPTTDRIQEPENQLINSSTPASPIANSSFEHGLMAAGFVSPTTTVNSNAEYDNQPVKQSLYTSLLNMFTTRNTNINSNNDNNSVAHTGSETSSNNGIIDEKNDPPDFEDDNLSLDCYEMNEEENVDDDVAANILALSVSDCETLVGWQV